MSGVARGRARAGLEQRVTMAGRAWADAVRSSLQEEGRPAAGGWPGTLSEARARATHALRASDGLSPEEHARLVRVLYDAARKYWLLSRDGTSDDA